MTNHKNRVGKNRVGLGAAVALIAASTLVATPSVAQPRYDGTWSVALVTIKGDCMASFRYPIEITNGALGNGGGLAIDVRGRVAANGAVTVRVSHGDTHAAGSGRLSSAVGSGSWTAERRG